MIEESLIKLVMENGFAMAIAIILLYDKIKSNGSLRRTVENNTIILERIERRLR